jgi:hypothetical protein
MRSEKFSLMSIISLIFCSAVLGFIIGRAVKERQYNNYYICKGK